MKLLIVVVNYRTPDLAVDCLRTLSPEVESSQGTRVVVVENASGDDSASRIEAAVAANGWEGWVDLLPLDRNGGFAAGNNAAIGPALASGDPPDYVLLLNPDTLVRPGAVATLLAFMDARPDVGLAGSRLDNPDGSLQASWFPFPSALREFETRVCLRVVSRMLAGRFAPVDLPESPTGVDWVSGACLIARRSVFETIGLLDDGFFMYFEEVDFCLRARRAGFACFFVPDARVVHLVGRSSGVGAPDQRRKRLPGYWFLSRKRYYLKHHGRAGAAVANFSWVAGTLLMRVRRALTRTPDVAPAHFFRDFVRFNFLMAKQ